MIQNKSCPLSVRRALRRADGLLYGQRQGARAPEPLTADARPARASVEEEGFACTHSLSA
jgi:hypothetical protein